jgi:hypothetical protein
MALFVALVIAPIALFWHVFFPPSPSPPPGRPVPPPDQSVVQQFMTLREEHDQAMRLFQDVVAAAGAAVVAATHPGKQYFLRLVELAEKHPEHAICPHIVGFALHCAGPHLTPEDHLRIKWILEQHHRLSKPGVSP